MFVVVPHLLFQLGFASRASREKVRLQLREQREDPSADFPVMTKLKLLAYKFFNFNFYVSFFLELYLFIILVSAEELREFSEAPLMVFSYFLSLGVLVAFLLLAVLVGVYTFRSVAPHQRNWSVESLFSSVNLTKKTGQSFSAVFLARRTALTVAVVAVREKYSQAVLVGGYHLAHFVFIGVGRPFAQSLDNLVFAVTDVGMLGVMPLYFVIVGNGDLWEVSASGLQNVGDVMAILILTTNVIISIIMTISTIKILLNWKRSISNKEAKKS